MQRTQTLSKLLSGGTQKMRLASITYFELQTHGNPPYLRT